MHRYDILPSFIYQLNSTRTYSMPIKVIGKKDNTKIEKVIILVIIIIPVDICGLFSRYSFLLAKANLEKVKLKKNPTYKRNG
ncbi:MAG: hypothetical protein ABIJ40_01565 [Bacteroidota bacterium]